MRAHSSLRLGSLCGTTLALLVSPWYRAWSFCVVRQAGLPHKTSFPPAQRRNGRAFSSLTARGGGLPVGVTLDLQWVFNQAYDRGPYRRGAVDYEGAPEPPLDPDNRLWAYQQLREQGLRLSIAG